MKDANVLCCRALMGCSFTPLVVGVEQNMTVHTYIGHIWSIVRDEGEGIGGRKIPNFISIPFLFR